ncbi:MAG: HNH endonuclease [Phycisphaerae bacterium]|nr:HNH endonuclease [Phycisphaerae bacterium]
MTFLLRCPSFAWLVGFFAPTAVSMFLQTDVHENFHKPGERPHASAIAALPKDRQRIVATVSRLARDSDFRRKVIIAYDRRCAVTGLQLKLVDAAHIVPVGAAGSCDDVTNGLCLSPTYHRAYDRGLVVLTENYEMQINRKKERELARLGFSGGLAEFKAPLGRQIILPADRRQWPAIECIRSANAFRLV